MKAVARRTTTGSYTHEIEIRQHRLTADEPQDLGGNDEGASPQEMLAASLAACTAITVEMYARRKEWEIGQIEVECSYSTPERGEPTQFDLVLRLPAGLEQEQYERLQTIAAKCPVHRTLAGETRFAERIEFIERAQSTT